MTFEPLPCWWCSYLKSIETLTTKRKLVLLSGAATTTPLIQELVICQQCDNENPLSVQDQIKLIVSSKPELADWLTINPLYQYER